MVATPAESVIAIRRLVAKAIDRGEVAWSTAGVAEKELRVDGMRCRARSVASLAPKHATPGITRGDAAGGCALCALLEEAHVNVARHVAAFSGEFESAGLRCTLNNFPFCANQLLILSTRHQQDFSERQWTEIRRGFRASGLTSGAFQTSGSGATVPGHAHISVFDESLPILALRSRRFAECEHAEVGELVGYPAVAITIRSDSDRAEMTILSRLIQRARANGMSANVILGHEAGPVVIFRHHERDPLTQRRVGNVEVAGILLSNADRAPNRTVRGLEAWMRQQSESATADEFRTILQRTCAGPDAVRAMLSSGRSCCPMQGSRAC